MPQDLKLEMPLGVQWRRQVHQSEATAMCFDRDGELIYTGGVDGIVKSWTATDGKEQDTMKGLTKTVTDVCASLENDYVLASSTDQNRMMLFRLQSKQRLVEYHGHTDIVSACCFNFNHKRVVSCSQDRTVRFWDMLTTKNVQTTNCGAPVHNLDLSANEEMLVTAHNREIGVWDAN